MMLDLGPIEERLAGITDRPWTPHDCGTVWGEHEWVADPATSAIGTFIAHAPEDIAALIAEVKKLRESIMRGLRCTQPNNT